MALAAAPAQPRLFPFRMQDFSARALLIGDANAEAARALEASAGWPGGALALVGPSGSGKTHMGRAWAAGVGAAAPEAAALAQPGAAQAAFEAGGGRVFVDAADGGIDGAALTLLLDRARAEGGAVLLAGRASPALWPAATADLTSRLAALAAVRLREPDAALLEALLLRLCKERFLALDRRAARYLAERMERSYAAAAALADLLDGAVIRGARPAGLADARAALALLTGAAPPDGDSPDPPSPEEPS